MNGEESRDGGSLKGGQADHKLRSTDIVHKPGDLRDGCLKQIVASFCLVAPFVKFTFYGSFWWLSFSVLKANTNGCFDSIGNSRNIINSMASYSIETRICVSFLSQKPVRDGHSCLLN